MVKKKDAYDDTWQYKNDLWLQAINLFLYRLHRVRS